MKAPTPQAVAPLPPGAHVDIGDGHVGKEGIATCRIPHGHVGDRIAVESPTAPACQPAGISGATAPQPVMRSPAAL